MLEKCTVTGCMEGKELNLPCQCVITVNMAMLSKSRGSIGVCVCMRTRTSVRVHKPALKQGQCWLESISLDVFLTVKKIMFFMMY